mmetsp:Transcript_61124/g.107357  ORF Transcript_61124/g.107357 Transcript_61124/m.107357 type:complete len:105 (-) Transcript_61124:30-344(-)
MPLPPAPVVVTTCANSRNPPAVADLAPVADFSMPTPTVVVLSSLLRRAARALQNVLSLPAATASMVMLVALLTIKHGSTFFYLITRFYLHGNCNYLYLQCDGNC